MAKKSKKPKPGKRRGKDAPKGAKATKRGGKAVDFGIPTKRTLMALTGRTKSKAPAKSQAPKKGKAKKRKRYGFYKFVPVKSTVADAISEGFSAIQELRDEMAEQEGNMSGTPAEHTPKYETVQNAQQELDAVADNEPEIPASCGDIECSYSIAVPRRSGKGTGRSYRLSNATAALQAAQEALNNVPEDAAHHEEAADLAQTFDDAANVDVSDWPTMYG